MTEPEARMIAFLRMRHGYTFSQLWKAARAIWSPAWVDLNSHRKGGGQIQGQGLILHMEEVLGLDVCESDDMIIASCLCMDCKANYFYITTKADTAKQCQDCKGSNLLMTPSPDSE